MWTIDATQHIHVEPSVPEIEVLARATAVAQNSTQGERVFLDILPVSAWSCGCGQPESWKTFQVILYAPHVSSGKPTKA